MSLYNEKSKRMRLKLLMKNKEKRGLGFTPNWLNPTGWRIKLEFLL